MSVSKLVFLVAAIASLAQSADVSPQQSEELNLLLGDIKSHFSDYLSVAEGGNVNVPPNLLQIYQVYNTATDSAYTSLYSDVNFTQVSSLVTALPWYSSRLAPELASITSSGANSAISSSVSASSSSASASSSSSAAASSSSASSVSSAISSISSSMSASSASVSSTSSVSSRISSISSSASSAAKSSSSHNAAGTVGVSVCGGVVAALAMLL